MSKKETENKTTVDEVVDIEIIDPASLVPMTDLPASSTKTEENIDWNVRSIEPADALLGVALYREANEKEKIYDQWLNSNIKNKANEKALLLISKFGKGFAYAEANKETPKAVIYPELTNKVIEAHKKILDKSIDISTALSSSKEELIESIIANISNLNVTLEDAATIFTDTKVVEAYEELNDYVKSDTPNAKKIKRSRAAFADLIYDVAKPCKFVEYTYKTVDNDYDVVADSKLFTDWKINKQLILDRILTENSSETKEQLTYSIELITGKLNSRAAEAEMNAKMGGK